MAHDFVVQRELNFLGIHQHKLQLRRVATVEHADEHGVQSDGLSLSRGSCHQKVRHFGQIKDVGLVADGLSQCNRQGSVGILEFVTGNERFHAHHIGVVVGDLDADGSLARDGRDDSNAEGGQTQGDVVFEVLDFADPDAGCRDNLVQGHGGTDFGRDFAHFDVEVGQGSQDVFLVLRQFLVRHAVLAIPVIQQLVNARKLEVAEFQGGVKLPKLFRQIIQLFTGEDVLLHHALHFKLHIVARFFVRRVHFYTKLHALTAIRTCRA